MLPCYYFSLVFLFAAQVLGFRRKAVHQYQKEQSKEIEELDYPVIGILDSPMTRFLQNSTLSKEDTMIPSSYVKLIESTGAHTLRIPYYASYEQLDYFLSNINGLLLTGGSQLVRFENTKEMSQYGKKIKHLLNRVIEINEKGQNFPVYGICNGFSQMVCSFSTNKTDLCDVLTYRHHIAEKKKIKFTEPLVEPFLSMKDYITDVLQEEDQLVFYHSLYLEPSYFQQNSLLNSLFQVSSLSLNYQGVEFISSIHHKNYPIFADVFHPEKSAYEWKPTYVSHKKESILFGYYIAKYFVDQASLNTHITSYELRSQFLEFKEDTNLLLTPTLSYESIYVFKYDSSFTESPPKKE